MTADGRDGGGAGLRANKRGGPGILGRRAQGEAGGNRGRDRGRAVVRAGKEELTTWVPRVSGRGVTRRLRRQAPTCGPALPAERRRACRRMRRWASAGVACAAGGSGTGRCELGRRSADAGVWAGIFLRLGFGERRERWAAARLGAGFWLWFPFLFLSSFLILFPLTFLILTQTKFEFKYKFEFKPHSNKNMHQHECNTNF